MKRHSRVPHHFADAQGGMRIYMQKNAQTNKRGYVVLMSVLILGVVVLVVATSVLLSGTDAQRNGAALEKSYEAKALSDACAEDALQEIRDNDFYAGPKNLTLATGSCMATVSIGGGENRVIESVGTTGTIKRKVRVEVTQISPEIVAAWEEVADF